MSRAAKEVNESKEVVENKSSTAVASLMDEMEQHAGKGVSTKAEDSLVPLIYVLDAKSPQCDDRGSAYIPGAKAGSIWLRNFGLVDGQEGILFQPCSDIWVDWVEWVPRERGGGFVGRHAEKPMDVVESPHPENPNKMRLMRPNGNEIRETRNVAGFVITENGEVPFVIPFASTGHTVAKGWNFTMLSHKLPNGKIEPAFARKYRLTTRQRSNTQGKWYVINVSDEGYVTVDQFHRGADLYEAFKSGEKRAEEEISVTSHEPDDSM